MPGYPAAGERDNGPLDGFAQVVSEKSAVADLHGLRRSAADRFGVGG
jgi:hypothetical protein